MNAVRKATVFEGQSAMDKQRKKRGNARSSFLYQVERRKRAPGKYGDSVRGRQSAKKIQEKEREEKHTCETEEDTDGDELVVVVDEASAHRDDTPARDRLVSLPLVEENEKKTFQTKTQILM
jgi:hypothetical protein